LFFLSILLIMLLFFYDFELFACLILVIYSSVYLLLSLLLMYFHKYWSNLYNSESFSMFFVLLPIVIFVISATTSDDGILYSGTKFTFFNYTWILRLYFYDIYSLFLNFSDNLLFFMHIFIYRAFFVEATLINIYLLFGLILAIGLLLWLKLWINPGTLLRFKLLNKSIKWFYYPRHLRLFAINKLKRQIRRQNSSLIKFDSDGKYELKWYKN